MSQQQERFLAIVNPAAGGGKSAKLAGETLAQLRKSGRLTKAGGVEYSGSG